jgi:tetratricopeptide (TPR) repeat protein
MLGQLVGVHASRIRAWQRRGWIEAVEETHRLAYFDFAELTVAKQLARLHQSGISPRSLAKKLAEIQRRFPDVARPLAELTLVLDGRTLLVRRGNDLVEPGGQLRIDFESIEREGEGELASIPSPTVFLSGKRPVALQEAAPEQLAVWAAELDETGELQRAAEMYRAALAAGGASAELCFHLADVLYRAGDLSAARERYFMALELDEDYVEARANLGCVLLELGQVDLAIAAFMGALRSHSSYADVHYHLARVFDELGRRDEATEHWRKFAALMPDSPWTEEAQQRLASAMIDH